MQFKNIVFAAFASVVSVHAHSIVEVLNNTPELSTLKSLVTQFQDLVDTLSKAKAITILAPTNDAFAKFLKENPGADTNLDLVKNLLTYHVITGTYDAAAITGSSGPVFVPTLLTNHQYTLVSGGQKVKAAAEGSNVVFTSGLLKKSTVTQADVRFEGGVAHLVDTVLTIPATTSETAQAAGLTLLVGALKSAGLVELADTTHDITVFAPNNDAFAALASVSGVSQKDIAKILSYHIVARKVAYSTTFKSQQKFTTLNGGTVIVHIEGNTVRINDATIVTADVLLRGGVAHVIDRILLPSGQDGAGTDPGSGAGTGPGSGAVTGPGSGAGTGPGSTGGGTIQPNATVPGTNFTAPGVPTPTTTPVVSTGAAVANWAGMAIDKVVAAGFAALAIGAAI